MKRLYESILNSTGTGLKGRIDEWCKAHEIYKGNYTINSDYTISPANDYYVLNLSYNDYDELPEYIKFSSDDRIQIHVHIDNNKVKSFRGLPELCRFIHVTTEKMMRLPELKIKVSSNIYAWDWIKSFDKLDVEWIKNSEYTPKATIRVHDEWKNIKLKGFKILDFVNDFNMGDKISKVLTRKAEMNKYKYKYETPISAEGLKALEDTLGKFVDLKELEEIRYTQNSKLVKYIGEWYRCKNW